ncbi:uncharacterized protein ARMOST_03224 [Armillaria ostoyae]|uniref:Retrotransposon gag domain-containing protein n=1 Tax=Armillaria ostoyae TaxID=47428 RepID=A0A284QU15_ARMOS|nr:uncharacterized protein ARMOST_03224 [Armillaria ostoyae]
MTTPHLDPSPLSETEETATPSTPMALTLSGPYSPLSIERFSAPTAPKPGRYDNGMSRPDTTSLKTTGPSWTGTWPYTVATQLSDQAWMPRSPQEYLPTGSKHSMAWHPGQSYMGNIAYEQDRSSATWNVPYETSRNEKMPVPAWMDPAYNDFNHFEYDEGTFGDPQSYREATWSSPPKDITWGNTPSHLQPFPDSLPDCQCQQREEASRLPTSAQLATPSIREGGPMKVAFAAFYFEGLTKNWWVHKRQEFWSNSDWDGESAHFRYLSWQEFVGLLTAQFHDPTIEEVYEKRMFNLWMSKGPAITYFQKLEIEAKKAGRRGDDQA